MATSNTSNEKTSPETAMSANHPESLSNSEGDDLAVLALEKRVLRKTDLVVLPMVILSASPLRWYKLTVSVNVDVSGLLFPV